VQLTLSVLEALTRLPASELAVRRALADPVSLRDMKIGPVFAPVFQHHQKLVFDAKRVGLAFVYNACAHWQGWLQIGHFGRACTMGFAGRLDLVQGDLELFAFSQGRQSLPGDAYRPTTEILLCHLDNKKQGQGFERHAPAWVDRCRQGHGKSSSDKRADVGDEP
jgi:hypothetical protein